MKSKLKPLSDQVMVITGASSGIGLATARRAAAEGARVVLAARSADVLERVAAEITEAGGQAIAVPTDVADRAQVDALAQAAVARFGRIDTWINNAGVSIWGRLDKVPEPDMRQLFDINLWGTVNGSMAAVPHLKESGGALINVGSILSDQGMPIQGIYAASKHAVKGFTDALRAELAHDDAAVTVTLIKPASVGTPLTKHARNLTGRKAVLPPPVYLPEDVARVILHAATHPTREAHVGGAGPLMSALAAIAPGAMDIAGATIFYNLQLGEPQAPTEDNLHHGQADGQERGEHPDRMVRPSLYSRAMTNPALPLAAVALVGAGILLSQSRPRGRGRG